MLFADNECLLKDQPFDETFDYRVRAVNEAGESAPSKSTEVRIHEPEEAPELPEVMDDVVAEAGKPLELRVPFKGGKPKPTAQILKDGEPVEDADVEVLDDEIVFRIPNPELQNAGNYGIKLTNPFGESETKGNIKVLDRPMPPEDLELTEIFKETASMQWKAPSNDGGSPITGYNIERMDHKRGTWVPMESKHPNEKYTAKKLGQ